MDKLNNRQLFFVAWTVGAIGVIILLIATYGRTWRFAYYAKITELSVCQGMNSDGVPIPVTLPITTITKEINICAHLDGIGPHIPLWILVKHDGNVIATTDEYYQLGYITTRFVARSSGLDAGNYSVLVYEGRHQLAATEFKIEQP